MNYCIQALSTALWKYAGFEDFNWSIINQDIENKIISLAKINHNHIIVLDNDGNYEDKRPSEFDSFKGIGKIKARLLYQLMKYENQMDDILENNFGDSKNGKMIFWINDGTIETYLEHFVNNKGEFFSKYFDFEKSEGYFCKKREGDNYSKSKVGLASEIADYALKNGLTFCDFALGDSPLENRIKRMLETIKSWNK